jgi:hypothetical protein
MNTDEHRWAVRGPAAKTEVCSLFAPDNAAPMRYTASMTNTFAQSMKWNLDDALRRMRTAVADCPDELWMADLWPDQAPARPGPAGGLEGSAPWNLAHHALYAADLDLSGAFGPWEPPPPFRDHVSGLPSRVFTRDELLGYVEYCRERARSTLDGMTEEAAARPLPSGHRFRGVPFGMLVGNVPLHIVEHAAQIRQFLTAAGVKAQAVW